MKKVLCIQEGFQKNNNQVKVGEIYTVIDVIDGWHVMNDNERKFYLLAEKGDECVYFVGLFVDLDEVEEEIKIEKECITQQ